VVAFGGGFLGVVVMLLGGIVNLSLVGLAFGGHVGRAFVGDLAVCSITVLEHPSMENS
jgi:hypothetical protein